MSESTSPLDFYFDFSSPYSYLLSEKTDELAARFGRKVHWHPILIGIVFKAKVRQRAAHPAIAAQGRLFAARLRPLGAFHGHSGAE